MTDTAPAEPTPAPAPTLLERAKADLHGVLRDIGHPIWAADQLVKHFEAFIEAKFAALKKDL